MPLKPSPVRTNHPPFPLPFTTVDVVIFTVIRSALHVLLVRRATGNAEPHPDQWALPGGFVDLEVDEDLISCAKRKLLEKTGVASPYLEQLGSWGNRTRDPRGWSATHVYFALLAVEDLSLQEGANATEVGWANVGDALKSALAFDHSILLNTAVERLRSKVEYTSLPAYLLPEPFTLPQLQRMYEIVLGRLVDKSGFRTRMLAADFLEEAGMMATDANRPSMSYRLRDRSALTVFPRTFSPRE
jgi:8-oxo-dGTP diphosphatase